LTPTARRRAAGRTRTLASTRHTRRPRPGYAASLAAGVFSDPDADLGYSWPTGSGGWTFAPGQLPRLTDAH